MESAGPIRPPKVNSEVFPTAKQSEPGVERRAHSTNFFEIQNFIKTCRVIMDDGVEVLRLLIQGMAETHGFSEMPDQKESGYRYIEEFMKNYDRKDTNYIESKYLVTLMFNNLKGRENKFLNLAFRYAKSMSPTSSVHLKVF